MGSQVRNVLLEACRHFMIPVARFLIQNGLTFKEFSSVAKMAFVQVASEEYGIRGRKTNVSRTAVLTGLTRKEVKRVRDELASKSPKLDVASLNKPAQLLSIWHEDKRFIDPDGKPRNLQMEGIGGFRDLLRAVGGDIPPGAMLTELARAGCVEIISDSEFKCLKREFNPAELNEFQASRYGECLHDLADTLQFNLEPNFKGNRRRFEYRVWNDKIPTRRVENFEAIVRESGLELLENFDKWLALNQAEQAGSTSKSYSRCGVGIYFFDSTL